MHYEQFLFTRNRRQDFTAFVRPARLTNKEVSTIGAVFNYVSDISRLQANFPSLYCFPLGDYLLLLRHYNSGRRHAGRAIGVIEGVAVAQRTPAASQRRCPPSSPTKPACSTSARQSPTSKQRPPAHRRTSNGAAGDSTALARSSSAS